jgi:serralysin
VLNQLYGDAVLLGVAAAGGNDTLVGGDGASTSFLYGDAYFMFFSGRGGDDRLISGTGTDHMWGDAQFINVGDVPVSPTTPTLLVVTGTDSFVFAPGNGDDDIGDFRQSDHDRIDVSAWGFHSLADMAIIDTGANTRIQFDATNSVTLVGLGDPGVLQASDFLFA